jgi:hypothetical protein
MYEMNFETFKLASVLNDFDNITPNEFYNYTLDCMNILDTIEEFADYYRS